MASSGKDRKASILQHGGSYHTKVIVLLVTVCITMLSSCVSQPIDSESPYGETPVSDNAITISLSDLETIPKGSAAASSLTPEEATTISNAAELLHVPPNDSVICTIGEPFYSKELEMELRCIAFYENDMLCAGADCAEDGTPVANFVYY